MADPDISFAEAANFGRTATLLKKYSAAIKLQSLARVVIAKTCVDSLKKNDAATIIQALYRGSNQMSEYKSDLRITIKAQAAVRGFIQRQKGALNKNPNDAVQNQVIEVMQPVESRGFGCGCGSS